MGGERALSQRRLLPRQRLSLHGDPGLTYRGYDIKELADSAQFEEVAYLLLKGELPSEQQLDAYKRELRRLRTLPTALLEVLERIPADAHPMDVLRTGCSMLGDLEP